MHPSWLRRKVVVLTSAAATTRAMKPSGIGRTSVFSPGQRLADVGQQGRPVFTGCLAAQNDPAAAPVDVTQLQSRYLDRAQPQARDVQGVDNQERRNFEPDRSVGGIAGGNLGLEQGAQPPLECPSSGLGDLQHLGRGWICANRDATYAVGLTVVRAGRCVCCERSLSLRPMNSARRADRRGIRIPATMVLEGLQSGSRRSRVPSPVGEVLRG